MTLFKLGTNLIFAGNRFIEPEEWSKIAREELDLDYIQFSADVLDPFWPQSYINEYLVRTRDCLSKYNLTVDSVFSGNFSRRHLMLHPDAAGRAIWFDWYKRLLHIGSELGAISAGSHFGAMTVKDINDATSFHARRAEGIHLWQELSQHAKDLGYRYLFFETMSIPREMAYSIHEARELHDQLNERSAIPIYYCLDVGHAPAPEDRDPYRWIRELGKETCIVHLQQSDLNNSRHWPFVPEYNHQGVVDPQKVLQAIEESGAKDMYLHFEILHRESFELENRVISDLKGSVEYWRKYLKEFREIRLEPARRS
jgi:D-erythrulose 1-phosphate 3-epimerase